MAQRMLSKYSAIWIEFVLEDILMEPFIEGLDGKIAILLADQVAYQIGVVLETCTTAARSWAHRRDKRTVRNWRSKIRD